MYATQAFDDGSWGTLMGVGGLMFGVTYVYALTRGIKSPGLIGSMLAVLLSLVPLARKILGPTGSTVPRWLGVSMLLSLSFIALGSHYYKVPRSQTMPFQPAMAASDWEADTRGYLESQRVLLQSMRTDLKPGDITAGQNYNLLLKQYTARLAEYQESLKTHALPKGYVSTPLNPPSWKPGAASSR